MDVNLVGPPSLGPEVVIFRAMAADGDEPALSDRDLGVRVPTDIEPDARGHVYPLTGGMSVTPHDPDGLPTHRRPRELGGTSKKPLWSMLTGKLTASLSCRPTSSTHALAEPAEVMEMAQYVAALHDSRPHWEPWHV